MKFAKALDEDQQPELHALYKQLKKSLRIFEGASDARSAVEPPHLPSSSDDDVDLEEADVEGDGGQQQQQQQQHQVQQGVEGAGRSSDRGAAAAGSRGQEEAAPSGASGSAAARPSADQEAHFVLLVEQCVQQLNEDFLSREEMLVIKADLAQSAAAAATSHEELLAAYSSVVNLHGELVLLCHWSMMAYTGIVKILKKHYKRTGHRVQSALLGNLLGQPFCSLEEVRGMVRTAEQQIAELGSRLGLDPSLASMAGAAAAAAVRDPASQQQQQLEALRGSGSPAMASSQAPIGGSAAAAGDPGSSSEQQQQPGPGLPQQQQQQGEAGFRSPVDQVAVVAASGRALLKRDRSKQYSEANKRHEPLARQEQPSSAAPRMERQSSGSSMQASQVGEPAQPVQPAQRQQPGGACSTPSGGSPPEGSPSAGGTPRRGSIMQRTKAALQLWKSLRSNASTPSTVLGQPNQQ